MKWLNTETEVLSRAKLNTTRMWTQCGPWKGWLNTLIIPKSNIQANVVILQMW